MSIGASFGILVASTNASPTYVSAERSLSAGLNQPNGLQTRTSEDLRPFDARVAGQFRFGEPPSFDDGVDWDASHRSTFDDDAVRMLGAILLDTRYSTDLFSTGTVAIAMSSLSVRFTLDQTTPFRLLVESDAAWRGQEDFVRIDAQIRSSGQVIASATEEQIRFNDTNPREDVGYLAPGTYDFEVDLLSDNNYHSAGQYIDADYAVTLDFSGAHLIPLPAAIIPGVITLSLAAWAVRRSR